MSPKDRFQRGTGNEAEVASLNVATIPQVHSRRWDEKQTLSGWEHKTQADDLTSPQFQSLGESEDYPKKLRTTLPRFRLRSHVKANLEGPSGTSRLPRRVPNGLCLYQIQALTGFCFNNAIPAHPARKEFPSLFFPTILIPSLARPVGGPEQILGGCCTRVPRRFSPVPNRIVLSRPARQRPTASPLVTPQEKHKSPPIAARSGTGHTVTRS